MQIDREQVAEILNRCITLAQADVRLRKAFPEMPIAVRWGLFEGFVGWRPPSTSGLVPIQFGSEAKKKAIEQVYAEAYSIGQQISLSWVPS